MSDGNRNGHSDGFSLLETQEQQRVTKFSQSSVPPPAEPPKKPICEYCGTLLSDPEKRCIFCPARGAQLEEEEKEEGKKTQPSLPVRRGWQAELEEADRLVPGSAKALAIYLGLRNRVPRP